MKSKNQGFVLPSYVCLRCGHKWNPRSDKKPQWCPNPKCHSPYWDIPRKVKEGNKAK